MAVEQHNPSTLSPALFSDCAADPNEKYKWESKKGPGYSFIFFGINRVIPTSDSIPQGCQLPLNFAFVGQFLKSVSEVNPQNCHQSFISVYMYIYFYTGFSLFSLQVKTPRNIKQEGQPTSTILWGLLWLLTYSCDLRQSQHILIKSVKTCSQGRKKCQTLSPGKLN